MATFEEWSLKQLEQDNQAERQSQLAKPPKPVASLLITMAEQFDNKEEPLCLLDLMKAAKLCRPQCRSKTTATRVKPPTTTTAPIWIRRLIEEGFITAHRDESKSLRCTTPTLVGVDPRRAQLRREAVAVHSVHSFELSCAATDLAEWPRPYFEFFEFPWFHGKNAKNANDLLRPVLSDALRCSEVREERKERLFLSHHESTQDEDQKNRRSARAVYQEEKPDGQQP